MKRSLIVLLTLVLMLGVCARAEIDYKAEYERLQAENASLAAENERLQTLLEAYSDPSVIVAFRGGSVRFEEVYAAYQETVEYYKMMYAAFDMPFEETPEMALEIQSDIARELADDKIIALYLEENDIALLSDERKREIVHETTKEYEELFAEVHEYYHAQGMSEEEADAEALAYFVDGGMDLDSLIAQNLNEARSEALLNMLTGDVTVSEEELTLVYEQQVESDRAFYEEYPEEFGFDALFSDTPIAYAPAGYRVVRMVIIPFDEEAMAAYDELYLSGNTASPEAEKLFAALKPEADKVYKRLISGESFDAIRAEYPLTQTYMDEFGSDTGFYMSAASEMFDSETDEAIMALDTVGDVTAPHKCDWGYAIFEYKAEVPEGAVPLADIREALYENTLSLRRTEAYEAAMEKMRLEAGTVYFLDRLN